LKIKIFKEKDDDRGVRISAGGNDWQGYYLAYSGDIADVRRVMEILLSEIETRKD